MTVRHDNKESPPAVEPIEYEGPTKTVEHDNRETPPAVDPGEYEGPSKPVQRQWNRSTTSIIIGLAIVFVVVVVLYLAVR